MARTSCNTSGRSNARCIVAEASAMAVRRKLAPQVEELLRERDGLLPVWIRSPKSGPEHYSGFSRAKLYQLAALGRIRSVSIREPGQVSGVRLFHLGSILDFICRCEEAAKLASAQSPVGDASGKGSADDDFVPHPP